MRKYIHILFLGAIMLLASCQQKRSYFPSDIAPVNVQIVRFDSALLNMPIDSTLPSSVRKLYADYQQFMPFFSEEIIGIPTYDTLALLEALPSFLQDTTYGFMATNQLEQETFSNVKPIANDMGLAFARIRSVYPDFPVPTVYLFVSGFNAAILFLEDDIAVGGDMYLGSDYPYYNRVVYDYQKYTMRPECIATDVVSACLFRYFAYNFNKSRLLDNMLYRGRLMYVLEQLFPNQKPWETFGYQEDKWKWCERNEEAIWRLMLDKQDLFKTETLVLTSYLNEGPFCSEISQECPARIGTWIGMQIVSSFMQNNPEVSLSQLLEIDDAQTILERSNYRP